MVRQAMIDERFIVLAILVNIYGSSSYIIGTLKGRTRPNRVTWFMFSLLATIIFVAMVGKDASITSSLMTLTLGILTSAIFIASFVNKKSFWKLTSFDVVCGSLSFVGIIAWFATGEGNLAILFSLGANFMAFLPTIIKSYNAPKTENWVTFFCGSTGSFVTLLTIKTWDFASVAFPLYVLIVNLFVAAIIKYEIGTRQKFSRA
jgi:hypothetical protein